MRAGKLLIAAAMVWASSLALVVHATDDDRSDRDANLDIKLARVLRQHEFTGRIELTLGIGLGVASRTTSRISAACSGSTTSTRCTGTTRAAAAIRRPTASATRSRSRSASTTTGSSGRIGRARAISAARRS